MRKRDELTDPNSCLNKTSDMVVSAELSRLEDENKVLRSIVKSLAARVVAQSEILARNAEKGPG